MYEELVKWLRNCASDTVEDCAGCPYRGGYKETYCMDGLISEAADAIEELSMRLHGDEAAIAGMKREIERMVVADNLRWIPVTERLPEDEKNVLVCYGFVHDGVMTERRFIGVLEYFAFDVIPHWQHESTGLSVTHWMPLPSLPEPPKED